MLDGYGVYMYCLIITSCVAWGFYACERSKFNTLERGGMGPRFPPPPGSTPEVISGKVFVGANFAQFVCVCNMWNFAPFRNFLLYDIFQNDPFILTTRTLFISNSEFVSSNIQTQSASALCIETTSQPFKVSSVQHVSSYTGKESSQ